jgi:hypothetical protein
MIAEKRDFNSAIFNVLEHTKPTPPIEGKDEFVTYKKMVMSFVELASHKNINEALKPMVSKKLVEDIFDLPNAAGIAEYRELTLNLTNNLTGFQDLASVMLAEKEFTPAIDDLLEFVNIPDTKTLAKKQALEKTILSFTQVAAQKK